MRPGRDDHIPCPQQSSLSKGPANRRQGPLQSLDPTCFSVPCPCQRPKRTTTIPHTNNLLCPKALPTVDRDRYNPWIQLASPSRTPAGSRKGRPQSRTPIIFSVPRPCQRSPRPRVLPHPVRKNKGPWQMTSRKGHFPSQPLREAICHGPYSFSPSTILTVDKLFRAHPHYLDEHRAEVLA